MTTWDVTKEISPLHVPVMSGLPKLTKMYPADRIVGKVESQNDNGTINIRQRDGSLLRHVKPDSIKQKSHE